MVVERIRDRYDVISRLGAGGMGDVWLADDTLLGRRVAVKFVGEKELRENPGAEAILQDEARNAGLLLGHPQVVSVLDLIDVDTILHKGPAVILEYMDGCHVGEWIQHHALRLDDFTRLQIAYYIGLQTVDALHFAHNRKILHRDVKPQNIMLSVDGRVKVSDFGLSRVVEEITRTHTVWGRHTPLYSAPEQWEGEKPDAQTDVYQLCATLYHLIAGVPANAGATFIDLMRWHEKSNVVPLVDHVTKVNPDVATRILEGLSKSPDSRPSLWQIFDALSNALVKTNIRMTATVDVAEDGSHEELATLIALFTDFGREPLVKDGSAGAIFPHAMEAMQEAIGVTLLGGKAKLQVSSTRKRATPQDPADDPS